MSANTIPSLPSIGGAANSAQAGRLKPVDPLRVLRQHIWLLMVMSVVGTVLGVLVWGALRFAFPLYTSEVHLRVLGDPDETLDPNASERLAGTTRDAMERFIQSEVMTIKAEETLLAAIQRPDIRDNTTWFKQFDGNVRAARESLEKDSIGPDDAMSVSMVRDTQIIRVAVATRHDDDAPRIVQAITDVYLKKRHRDNELTSSQLRTVFVRERESIDGNIRRLSDRISEFASAEEIEAIDAFRSTAAIELEELTKQRMELQGYLGQAKGAYDSIMKKQATGQIEASPDDIATIEMMPEIRNMIMAENDLQISLKTAISRYGNKHYQTEALQTRLEKHQARKDSEMQRKLRELQVLKMEQAKGGVEMLQGQLDELMPEINKKKIRMIDMTTQLNQYQELVDQRDAEKDRLIELKASISNARIANERPETRRVKHAGGPTTPEISFPPKPYVLIPGMALLTLAMTLGIAFLREMLDQSVRSPADVQLLPEVDLLGVLPDATEDPSGLGTMERVVERQPTGLLAEQFRHMRSAILTRMDRRGYKTLLVVGAQPNCGTTSTVQNLAASLAFNGRRVLMIDANFRRPALCRTMGVNPELGLIDVLRGEAKVSQVIQKSPDADLWLLPAGLEGDAPPELLESQRFRTLLGEVEADYDMVLIDTAPALLASEAQVLSKHVDAIAVVIRAGEDKRGMIERVIRNLDGQRGDLLGVILNGVKSSAGGYFKKNYEAFYRYRNGPSVNGRAQTVEPMTDRAAHALEQSAVDED